MKPHLRLLEKIRHGLEFLQRQHARPVENIEEFLSKIEGPVQIQAGYTILDAYRRTTFAHAIARAKIPGRFNPFLSHEYRKREVSLDQPFDGHPLRMKNQDHHVERVGKNMLYACKDARALADELRKRKFSVELVDDYEKWVGILQKREKET